MKCGFLKTASGGTFRRAESIVGWRLPQVHAKLHGVVTLAISVLRIFDNLFFHGMFAVLPSKVLCYHPSA